MPSLALATTAAEISPSAKVSVGFAGTDDAGAFFVQTGLDQWAKRAFDRSPQGFSTIASVVTRGTSDDCDGPRHPADAVWLRLHGGGRFVAFHFSEGGRLLRFNRTFSLPRDPCAAIRLGLSAQAPKGDGCTARFAWDAAVTMSQFEISKVVCHFRGGTLGSTHHSVTMPKLAAIHA